MTMCPIWMRWIWAAVGNNLLQLFLFVGIVLMRCQFVTMVVRIVLSCCIWSTHIFRYSFSSCYFFLRLKRFALVKRLGNSEVFLLFSFNICLYKFELGREIKKWEKGKGRMKFNLVRKYTHLVLPATSKRRFFKEWTNVV